MQTKESIVKQMAGYVLQGAEQIQEEHGISEEQAIWVAFKYACEWVEENRPDVAAHWISILSEGKE